VGEPAGGRDSHREAATPQQGNRYRTKLEVLRDFLNAVQKDSKKTRIIGLANLNPTSFERYLTRCIELDLVRQSSGGGFRLSPKGPAALKALERVVDKRTEYEGAVRLLQATLGREESTRFVAVAAGHQVSRLTSLGAALAFSDLEIDLDRLSTADRRSGGSPVPPGSRWRIAARYPDAEEDLAIVPPTPDVVRPSRETATRTRLEERVE
jgi:predicted transcriptional regulator